MAGDPRPVRSLCAKVVKGNWSSLLNLNSKLDYIRLTSSTIVNEVLLLLSPHSYGVSQSWAFFKFLENIPGESCFEHSLETRWTMVHLLVKHQHLNSAQHLLDKISQRDFLYSSSALNTLVKTHGDFPTTCYVLSWLMLIYSDLGKTRDAVQVFEVMYVHRLKPHFHACTELLKRLVKDRKSDSVSKVFKKMIAIKVVPDIYMYNILIHSCCFSKDVDKAEHLMAEMEYKCILPDIVTYNTLISLYCKKSMHYEALCVQYRMERADVTPDIFTYNSILYAYCREGRMREAMKLFREMKDIFPNEITYTTLVDGYCRAGDLAESLRLLEVMKSKSFSLLFAYNSILRFLCKEGRLREGNKLLIEMSRSNINPDNVTCNTLINAYCKISDMSSAVRIKDKMLKFGLKLDVFTYKALIHGFCKVKEMKIAKQLLFSMIEEGFEPTYCIYSWIVDGFCNQNNEEAITSLPDQFSERGYCVNVSMCRALIRRLCKRDRLGSAEKIHNFMQSNNWPKDSLVYTSLAYANKKAGKEDVASEMLNEMRESHLQITETVYRSFNDTRGNEFMAKFWDELVDAKLFSPKAQKNFETEKEKKTLNCLKTYIELS